mmetsp:Transcript_5942/g.6791  ORF Transcript_5942/g.6791 Transcript_5942/m.6791 type:complete len:83 (-) Transcript_5942:450-698(-)
MIRHLFGLIDYFRHLIGRTRLFMKYFLKKFISPINFGRGDSTLYNLNDDHARLFNIFRRRKHNYNYVQKPVVAQIRKFLLFE